MKNKYFILTDGDEEAAEFTVERIDEKNIRVTHPDGTSDTLDVRAFGNMISVLTTDHKSVDLHVSPGKDEQFRVTTDNHVYEYHILNERKMRMALASGKANKGGGPQLQCPMAGKVILLKVEEGDVVEEGAVVVVVEAMKMENDLKAHLSGTVSKICVQPGDTVEIGTVLIEIESKGEEG